MEHTLEHLFLIFYFKFIQNYFHLNQLKSLHQEFMALKFIPQLNYMKKIHRKIRLKILK